MSRSIRKIICIIMIAIMMIPSAWLVYAEDTDVESPESSASQETAAVCEDSESVKDDIAETAETPTVHEEQTETAAGTAEPTEQEHEDQTAQPAPEPSETTSASAHEETSETADAVASEADSAATDQTAEDKTELDHTEAVHNGCAQEEVPAAEEVTAVTEAQPAETPAEEVRPQKTSDTDDTSAPVSEQATADKNETDQAVSGPEEETSEPEAAVAAAVPASRGSVVSVGAKSSGRSSGKSITIEGTKLNGSSSSSGNGWSYDSSNNTIVLEGFTDRSDITSDGTGVTIVTTGLNRIGTLSCDGQIDVIGTGILLIDKIELAEGCEFNLHSLQEIYGEDGGSAAVFLRQDDGRYLLINGSVTGVIDDEITMPDKTTLVLPENSSIRITGLSIGVTYDEDGEPEYLYSPSIDKNPLWDPYYKPDKTYTYFGKLTVDDLILEKGAVIIQAVGNVYGLEVKNKLVNNGTIRGNRIELKGDYSGTGVIEDARITVSKGQEMSITLKDSILSLNGTYVIDKINSSGSSQVHYDQDTTIKKIKLSAGGRLDIYAKGHFGNSNKLKLTGSVSGGDVYLWSGITEIGKQFKLLNRGKLNYSDGEDLSGAAVFDYSGSGIVSLGRTGPVFMGPDSIGEVPDQKEIPTVSLSLFEYSYLDDHFYLHEIAVERDETYIMIEPFDVTDTETKGKITFSELQDQYIRKSAKANDGDQSADQAVKEAEAFEVFRYADGKLSMTILGENYEDSVPNEDIILIRAIVYFPGYREPMGGSTGSSTQSVRTGSGVIGGNANSILIGTGITRTASEPDKPGKTDPDKPDPAAPDTPDTPDPVKPDSPDTPDPVKPDSPDTPDPVEPVGPDTPDPVKPAGQSQAIHTAVNASSSDILLLLIDMFDLNEEDSDEEALYYVLSAYQNGAMITELAAPVQVLMDYDLPEEFRDKQLYAVFANEDRDEEDPESELLTAYRAEYDEGSGQLSFETPQLGEFVITALEFEGEEFSPEFYDELGKAEEVQPLLELLKDELN